jgi:LmbE family N-acetylglucosaminyl deacetylase
MIGTPQNEHPGSFWKADVEEAAARLASVLQEEQADVLSAYDENGVYGHPDHIQVNRVGVRAGQLAGTRKVYLNTLDHDRIVRLMKEAPPESLPADVNPDDFDMGVPADWVTTRVDVSRFVDRKRQAMVAHASQIPEDSWFLTMPFEAFAAAFGEEDYILVGAPPGTTETDLFEGLA